MVYNFPSGPDQIPPSHLTFVLRHADVIPEDVSVKSYTTEALKGIYFLEQYSVIFIDCL